MPLIGVAFWGWSLMLILVVLVGLKTALDLALHLRPHRSVMAP